MLPYLFLINGGDIVNLPIFIKKLICKHKGHDFQTYPISTGYESNDVEMAGYCKRCHFDTHEEATK